MKLLPYFLNIGYPVRLLGLPIPGDTGDGMAFEIAFDDRMIERMREAWESLAFALAPADEPAARLRNQLTKVRIEPAHAG